ncbi:uncharacterized protein LOC117653543 [Thrips palmi]|uniref:Uncharacterized protein LOC117653543 n=1 Tax=Thrips palmi TaxID=161013 RepID=A0A6P9AAQ0_THRPL|nr:uncharacterized protein LOC117653543 [Thrips palmi]XP_034255179.1 uncharacterized protein LOC117653543 [Thrips palmi]XP_034255180.1 uncharacterized protein LOC117653543 [Thrips palmi]XP_034255181.1 uncharacterized protein LOC117653543 [Thrips palmi]XP_034255182.1 uncharacterized protein LOC117653543 [Thrips palmi]XP_034255183.1 uncharacterized protein LOC117653543 [Thrips palmi]XP_034255184.1 uncharacterized protein LOC117653543 [Thrips palmi]XP_034255185.1 uncharacterized protein LOC1176
MAPAAKRKNASEAGPSEGGLGAVRKQMRLSALEEENADLREQLAALQAPTQVLKYVEADRPGFLKNLNKSKGILMLDLSDLKRGTNSFDSGWYGMFPKWKPEKRLDGTVAAMVAATNEVQGLDLGDGSWAAEDHYAQELVKMLRKYSKTLTNVRVALSTLVERYETVASLNKKGRHRKYAQITMGKSNVMNVLGGMSKLSSMKLIVNCVGRSDHCEVAYGGEFATDVAKKKLFGKLKQLEVFLTDEWVRAHMGGADAEKAEDGLGSEGGQESDDDEDQPPLRRWTAYKPPRRDQPDAMVSDLLRCRGDVMAHLDMVPVRQAQAESPFVAQIAKLGKLRSIALQADMLAVTRKMGSLESIELHLDGRLSTEAVEKLSELLSTVQPLQKLKKLDIKLRQARVGEQVCPLLAAVAENCTRLEVFKLNGSGWRQEDVSALLQGGASESLRELHLDQCGALEAVHLPMIAALPKLAKARLPSRLLGQAGAAAVKERGLDLRWQY